jgi:hypothetical protein
MATYYGTYGQKVQYLASDPSDPQTGQVWYNSTSATLKVRQDGVVNAWAIGGNYPLGVSSVMSAGIQTAGIAFGGNSEPFNPSDIYQTLTAEYNGTAWTNNPTGLNTARSSGGGCGTQTATLAFNGSAAGAPAPTGAVLNTESYNGSTWTNVNNMNTARWIGAGTGTQAAALYAGGYNPGGGPQTALNAVEEWNGTSWSNVNNINSQRGYVVGAGIQTAAVIFGGYNWNGAGDSDAVENYNGTSWTTTTSLPNARYAHGGSGNQTAAISFGGTTNLTDLWNGSSWTNTNNMINSRNGITKQIGTQNNAVAVGGDGFGTQTEEFLGTGLSNKTITVS